ncbi:hypothetical protein BKA69DRAFT_1127315 [Paraphysoderma sedebokerense]|nr:hypothetical protein BKA69DRAFT_1127315 [Paraphysoderma sedebokerense]
MLQPKLAIINSMRSLLSRVCESCLQSRLYSTIGKSKPTLQRIRGMHDRLPEDSKKYRHLVSAASTVTECYGFSEISTPILEFSSLFERTLGEQSDVVGKEMYTFVDRNNELVTMRPEGTAGVARSLITNSHLQSQLPLKYYYYGPMFRYERPQKGRLRQFEQFGVELFGKGSLTEDIEILVMAQDVLKEWGLMDMVELHINTIGNVVDRNRYRTILTNYFDQNKDSLSPDSQTRLTQNASLRILDSKHPMDQPILSSPSLPNLHSHLPPKTIDRFKEVLKGLDINRIDYKVNEKLVRGLDYYTDTIFEFVIKEEFQHLLGKSQGTVLGGGRYNGLVSLLTSNKTNIPGIGWAAGLDRMSLLCNPSIPDRPHIMIITLPESSSTVIDYSIKLLRSLRSLKFKATSPSLDCVVSLDHEQSENCKNLPSLSKMLSKAAKDNANVALIIGGQEFINGQVIFKDLRNRIQRTVTMGMESKELQTLFDSS